MKKLIFIGMLITAVSANAQINLIHSTEDNYQVVDYNGDKYATVNSENESIDFYNADFSFSSSVNINVPEGFILQHYYHNYLQQDLFDTDSGYEFPIVFSDTSTSNAIYMIQIINEDGSVLKEFSNTSTFFIIHKINGESRLVIQRYQNYPDQYVYEYYSLPGTLEGKSQNQNAQISPPFPNPTGNTINIPYDIESHEKTSLHILNSEGKIMETKQIGGAFKQIKLDVSAYQPGMYVYQYDDVRGKFVVR